MNVDYEKFRDALMKQYKEAQAEGKATDNFHTKHFFIGIEIALARVLTALEDSVRK